MASKSAALMFASVSARRYWTRCASVASRSPRSTCWPMMPFHTSPGKLKGSVAFVRNDTPMSFPTNSSICIARGDEWAGFGRYLSMFLLILCTPFGHKIMRLNSGEWRSVTISVIASRYTPPASIPASPTNCTEKTRPAGSLRRKWAAELCTVCWKACTKRHCEVPGEWFPQSCDRVFFWWSSCSEMLPGEFVAVVLSVRSRSSILKS
mmetsp:Transcript_25393/g.34905  ORF Transcript_25393/g.34905 Transcript_25393/m.34905 type:complete len:208 (+) Transcript_25393:146-769(+)